MNMYNVKLADTKQPYTSHFIDQNNSDVTAQTKNRKNERLTVDYLPTDLIFSVVNGFSTEHIRHDNNVSNISNLTVVADKNNRPVFAYQHDKNGSNEKWVSVNWYELETSKWKIRTFPGKSPLLVTDEHRENLLNRAEVILYFVGDNNTLSHCVLSDGFTAVNNSLTLRNKETLTKVGITKNNRIQVETTRPVTEITYNALLGSDGLPILDKDRNPIWVGKHHPIV